MDIDKKLVKKREDLIKKCLQNYL